MKHFYTALSVFFSIIVIFYYLYTHPEYFSFFKGLPHLNFILFSLLFYGLLALCFEFIALKLQNLKFLSFTPFLLILVFNFYASQYFFLKQIGYWETADLWHMTKLISNSIGGLILIFGSCLIIGSAILKNRPAKFSEIPVKSGLGIMAVTYFLFILAYFKALNFTTISLGLTIMVIISINFIRKTPWKTWMNSLKYLDSPNILGHFSLWMLGIFITLNFYENLRPVPKGYDGMTIYANLSYLLKDYGELIKGFGSYNYSLFSSLGLILFEKPEFVLLMNFAFYILFIFALFVLGKKFLSTSLSLLVVASVQSIPMLNRMAFMQQKVETSLLFFSIILIALSWEMIEEKKPFLIVLVGLIAGFLFGIKYPSIILVLALISGLWYINLGVWGLVGISMAISYFILVSGIDEFSGLSFYHNVSEKLNYALLFGGLSILGILYFKQKTALINSIKTSFIIGIIAGLTFIPWAIKHYNETNSLSVNALLYGKSQSPNEQ